MKRTIKNFTIVTFLFSMMLVVSCKKETFYQKETLTVEDLITQYNLHKTNDLNNENSIIFSSADEAAKFIEGIKDAKPVKFLTNTSINRSKLQASSSNNSNPILSSELGNSAFVLLLQQSGRQS